jgi:DDE superfamily endonuclease
VKIKNSNQYCLDILKLEFKHRKALANLVMALSSILSRSVVGLSTSPVYRYQYTSICDTISNLSKDETEFEDVMKEILTFLSAYYASSPRAKIVFQTDTTSIIKAHSPTLEGKGYVQVPNNSVPGNKPVGVGYKYSHIHLSKSNEWSVPLLINRVKSEQTTIGLTIEQVQTLFDNEELGLDEHLVVNTLDSYYGQPAYLANTYKHANLVNNTRLRSSMTVYSPSTKGASKGRPAFYGTKFNLRSSTGDFKLKRKDKEYTVRQVSIFDHPHDDYQEYAMVMKKGRAVIVQIHRWNNMLLKSSKGHDMKDKSVDILSVRFVNDDKIQKPVFNKEMYLCLSGKRKDEIQTIEAQQDYRTRWDIEPSIRFAKQQLLLNDFQTPDIQHLDNWMLIVQLAYGLLYTASDETKHVCQKWQKYNEVEKQTEKQPRLTISQTKKAIEPLLLTFDANPFLPQKSENSVGRKIGQFQTPRNRHPVIKKKKNATKIKLTTEKIE